MAEFEKILNDRKTFFQTLSEINETNEALLQAALQDQVNLSSNTR